MEPMLKELVVVVDDTHRIKFQFTSIEMKSKLLLLKYFQQPYSFPTMGWAYVNFGFICR